MPGSIFVQSVEAISAKAFFMRGLTFSYNALFFRESKIMVFIYFSGSAFRGRRVCPAPRPDTKLARIFYYNKVTEKALYLV